jgi:hypothetical protein
LAHIRLGEREYDRAVYEVCFQPILSRRFNGSVDFDIPYLDLGWYSQDVVMIYVPRDVPPEVKRGKSIYPIRSSGLVRGSFIHEHCEKVP